MRALLMDLGPKLLHHLQSVYGIDIEDLLGDEFFFGISEKPGRLTDLP